MTTPKATPRLSADEIAVRLHGLVDSLANDYKGALPYDRFGNDENLDPRTRTRYAMIHDTVKKADTLLAALGSPKAAPRLPREQIIDARLDELRELVKHLTLHPYAASAHAWIKQRREELESQLAALGSETPPASTRPICTCRGGLELRQDCPRHNATPVGLDADHAPAPASTPPRSLQDLNRCPECKSADIAGPYPEEANFITAYECFACGHKFDTPVLLAALGSEGACGKCVIPFIAREGSYFPCALPKGHEGGCRAGGDCFKHGPYINAEPNTVPKCPKWPDCIPDTASEGPDTNQLIVDAYNKSREGWVEKGWVEPVTAPAAPDLRGDDITHPIKLDTNASGQIFVDQEERDSPLGARVILNQAQVKAIADYATALAQGSTPAKDLR